MPGNSLTSSLRAHEPAARIEAHVLPDAEAGRLGPGAEGLASADNAGPGETGSKTAKTTIRRTWKTAAVKAIHAFSLYILLQIIHITNIITIM